MVHQVVRRIGGPLVCLATVTAPIAGRPIHADRPRTAAQDRTVWQGVYSAEQADRGRTAYERHCASCHGNDLAGRGTEALLGEAFRQNWSESSVYDLFEKIRSTMPPNMGRNLDDPAYVDIVAYILQQNAFPVGPATLGSDSDTLRHIRIQNREGPAAVPSFALVKVVGCLERPSGGEWTLTHAADAVRTRLPYASETPDTEPPGPAAGDLTFRLFGIYPSPDTHMGSEVEVRGFLIRTGAADRINVTSLRTVAGDCRTTKQ